MSYLLPSPLKISFENWVKGLAMAMPTTLIRLEKDEKKWREWGAELILSDEIFADIPFPSKINYPNDEDWRIWAAILLNTIYN